MTSSQLLDATQIILASSRTDAEIYIEALPKSRTVTAEQQVALFVSLCCAYFYELTNLYITRYDWESVEPYLTDVLKELDICVSTIADRSGSTIDFAKRYDVDSKGWREGTSMINPLTYIFLSLDKNYGESTIDIGQVMSRYTVFQDQVNNLLNR